jgi:porin
MKWISGLILTILLWGMCILPASAQKTSTDSSPVKGVHVSESEAAQFGGPSSVGGTLSSDRESEAAVPARVDLLDRYFGFKRQVRQEYGFSFGFDYNALLQYATQSLGEDTAAGGVFRAFGQWTLVGGGTENTGTLVYKVENRHRLGTDIAPQDLGFETGYAGLTAVPFSDVGWALTNLFWNQHFLRNRVAFVAGVVDSTDYVDVYGLVNPWTDFSNLAFSTDPTIPAPDQGLGAAVRVMPTENIYIIGGIADANGDPTNPGDSVNSFFSDAEFFTHIEVGWISSWNRRFSDNIHLTAWHADERKQAGVSDGWGLAFSFSRLFADTWEPFFRAGYSEDGGALWECSISAGIGYHTRKKSDVIGLGLNWSRPSEDTFGPGLDDKYTAEIYYRLQVLKVLTITPDIQVLFNPALKPDEDVIFVFGLRGRISF